jgi:hypothetical protein
MALFDQCNNIIAQIEGREDMCKLLLQQGAPINAQDVYGSTPLAAAARCSRPSVVRFVFAVSCCVVVLSHALDSTTAHLLITMPLLAPLSLFKRIHRLQANA